MHAYLLHAKIVENVNTIHKALHAIALAIMVDGRVPVCIIKLP